MEKTTKCNLLLNHASQQGHQEAVILLLLSISVEKKEILQCKKEKGMQEAGQVG
jgi:hypothetical protein